MNANAILRYVAYAAYIILIATWPLRKKKIVSDLGNCVLATSRKTNALFIVVIVCAPLLIVLTRFRDFGLTINAVLAVSALLAAEVSIRDRIFASISGVYQNGIVVDGRYLPYDQIKALPTLGYDEEAEAEQNELYERALKIVTEKSGVVYVGFASKEEKDAAIVAILEQEPRLDIR